VEQQAWVRLDKAADIRDRQMLILHPEAHRASRQLLEVDILETVLETGSGTSLQCSQHGRIVQVA
jgi:hypothetical protein